MSHDRKTAKMTIILDVNPYSKEAMPIIEEINKTIDGTLNGTELKSTKKAIGGTTARNVDLKEVTGQDFLRTATIMLIGIAVVLLVITRSFLNTIFIIGSLILAYFASLGISEQISTHILNVESLSWNVPFFSFIMIVALGVDYSIFVMMRYNELEGGPSNENCKCISSHRRSRIISGTYFRWYICCINPFRCIDAYTSSICCWCCTVIISYYCDANIDTCVNRVNE